MKNRWFARHRSIVWVVVTILIFSLALIVWLGNLGQGLCLLFPPLDEYGKCSIDNSTIFSNILGILIAFFAAVLTFCAFFVQFLYNKKQRSDTAIERAESMIINQIQIYRDIVHNLELDKNVLKEKNILSFYFYEFKSIYYYANDFFNKDENGIKYSQETLLFVAMELFLTGLHKETGEEPDKEFNERLNLIDPQTKNMDLSKFCKTQGLRRKEHIKIMRQEPAVEGIELKFRPEGIMFISPRVYKGCFLDIYQGHLKEMVSYFKHIGLILTTIKDLYENKSYDMEHIAVSSCALFGAQLSLHESGLLYAYCCAQAHIYKHSSDELTRSKSKIFAEFSVKKSHGLENIVYNYLFSDIDVMYRYTFKWDDANFLSFLE